MVTFLVRQRPAAVTFQMTQCDDRAPWGCAECACASGGVKTVQKRRFENRTTAGAGVRA